MFQRENGRTASTWVKKIIDVSRSKYLCNNQFSRMTCKDNPCPVVSRTSIVLSLQSIAKILY